MGNRAMWVGAALIAACGGSTLSRPDEQAMPSAGRGAQPEPTATAGGPAVGSGGSGAGASVKAGAGGASLAGEGGVRQEPLPVSDAGSDTGSSGSGAVYCGGCSVEYSVHCSWDTLNTGQGGLYPDMDGFCEAVAQALGAPGEASQGGASAGGASPSSGGVCADYVTPPRQVDDGGWGCISYREEHLSSTCTIREECCVVLEIWDCGV